MAEKRKKEAVNIWRIISVMLGVLGSLWIFTCNWHEVASYFGYLTKYTPDKNFFSYFFGEAPLFPLFPFAALLTAMLFLIISLRDLYPIARTFSLVTAIFCAAVFLFYAIYFCTTIKSADVFKDYSIYMNIGRVLLLVAYFLFAMYCRNGGSVRNVAWVFAIAAVLVLGVAIVFALVKRAYSAETFLNQAFVLLSNVALMYCGLRQY
ncbi:MAG: hypothetical protein J5921_02510 [Clostridia bacterium]|nr:hypothetical protein [Clostridia bacterium]